jgi:hypothetical protein
VFLKTTAPNYVGVLNRPSIKIGFSISERAGHL